TQEVEPLFPFGHGLSYTTFAFSNLVATPKAMVNTSYGPGAAGQTDLRVDVTAKVTNTGSRAGSEVVQLYLGHPSSAGEPPRQLKGFEKVSLQPGQSTEVHFTLNARDLAYWKSEAGGWVVPNGAFQVYVGSSSGMAGLPLHGQFSVIKSAGSRIATLNAPSSTLTPGSQVTVTGTFSNDSDWAADEVRYQLQAPEGWEIKPAGTQPPHVGAHQSEQLSWRVTVPYAAQNTELRLGLQVGYETAGGLGSVRSAPVQLRVGRIADLAFQPAQVLLKPSEDAPATLAISNNIASPITVTWQAAPPPGVQLTPDSGTVTVAPGASSSIAVTVSANESAKSGSEDIRVSSKASINGESYNMVDTRLVAILPYPALAAAFNNVGITSVSNPKAGDFSGNGVTFSSDALAEVGLTPGAFFVRDGITFTWPEGPAGQPDNVVAAGQPITVSGTGSKLGFVGASAYGNASGTATIHYTDGTTQEFTLTMSDFYETTPADDNKVVAIAPYRHNSSGINKHTASIYSAYVDLKAGKTVSYVTLPDVNSGIVAVQVTSMHIFAAAIGG
ncbi:fibronectin type III-like domain-contianing protein, partial [Micromonospora sp. SL1-18]|uniref:fibronectin type III-like domain-contianing protein n=1 Tax=Micromonospora sp. SL1-18 TaxID=3399128 RepID=UPI003A4D4A24